MTWKNVLVVYTTSSLPSMQMGGGTCKFKFIVDDITLKSVRKSIQKLDI